MSDHVTDVGELVSAVNVALNHGNLVHNDLISYERTGSIDNPVPAGMNALAAIVTALEAATDENRKLRELARNVTEQAHIAQEDYDQHKTVNDQCRAFRLGYNMLMSLSTQAAEALAGSAAVDGEAG